jgi:hypothetical protein
MVLVLSCPGVTIPGSIWGTVKAGGNKHTAKSLSGWLNAGLIRGHPVTLPLCSAGQQL